MIGRSWLFSGAVLVVSATCAVQARAQASPASSQAALDEADELRSRGKLEEAIERLKAGKEAFPDDESIRLALAQAYLADENDFWALKVLQEYEKAHPPGCQVRAFQAWIHIRQANMELAEEILEAPSCDRPDEIRARFLLLKALVAKHLAKEEESRKLLREAGESSRHYEEDKALLDAMLQSDDPGRLPLASWRLDLGVGWTSNGLAGSPVDPATEREDASTPMVLADARVRFVLPTSRVVRPVLEGQLRSIQFTTEGAKDFSYRQPTLRTGLLFGDTIPRLLLTYTFDAVQVAGGDRYDQGPMWYSEAHRGEYEIEVTDRLVVFGGGGHRTFRESGRTRYELEQGMASAFPITRDLRLMSGISARWHRADNDAYDAVGATALAQLMFRLPEGFELRGNVSGSYDRYPQSQGFFAGSQGRVRRDLLLRDVAGVWSPSWDGLRVGLEYAYSRRVSTAQAYAYADHRVLLHGTWTFDSSRLGTSTIPADGRVPMEHGVSGAAQDEEMRIQDLMRQDESVKRGSSCLK